MCGRSCIDAAMAISWPLRSVLAGTAGTATLTLAYAAERRLRPRVQRPLDYDDSVVPGQIVASVMHLPHVTARRGSRVGAHPALELRLGLRSLAWHAAPARR